MYRLGLFILCTWMVISCGEEKKEPIDKELTTINDENVKLNETALVILGTVQDAGSPQIGCPKPCCMDLDELESTKRKVSALGIIDSDQNKKYLIDATPDIVAQVQQLNYYSDSASLPDAIFLTHAHIGHYTGLMYLGKEAINSHKTKVFGMPRMNIFLSNNGPWDQLVSNKNIELHGLVNKDTVFLSEQLQIVPFLVPHRDEYSETVGYKIIGPNRKALYIPDVDKWKKWNKNLSNEIKQVDFVLIDGTFYDGEEIGNRDLSEIPHPFVIETMGMLKHLSQKEKNKVYFIHFNHTNPLLDPNSQATKNVLLNGYHIAETNKVIPL